MMQKVLTKYWLTIHLGFVLFFSWFYLAQPAVRGLVPLLWLSLIALEALVLLPSVHRGETLADARVRVIRAIFRDPFFYLGMSVLVFATVQWLNSGCKLIYLAEADVWQFTPPALSWAPFSIEAQVSLTRISIFAACFAGCLCLRHAVGQRGKRYLLQAAMTLSGALAIFSVWQACRGIVPYSGFAFAREGSVLGSFFGFWLIIGMGVFADVLARGQRGYWAFFVVGITGNLTGMLFFSSAWLLVLYVLLALLLFIYWLAYLNAYVPKHVQVKLFFVSLVVIVGITGALLFGFAGNPVAEKVKGLIPLEQYEHALSETKRIRTTAALKVCQDHLWVGVGADGFRHFVGSVVGDKDWRMIKTDQASVYNDCLQFLCEYGLLGFGLLLSSVIMLMAPICYRARVAWKRGGIDKNEGRVFLFRLSPLVLTGVLSTGVCFLESWLASPFRSPSVLISWVVVLSVLPAFLPAKAQSNAKLAKSVLPIVSVKTV